MQKLMFEFDFYIEHTLLGYWQQALTESDLSRIRNQFLAVAEKLAAYPHKVFTHRDYHSRNVMLATDSSTQYIIDFQDARLGLVQYDLCSLLYDAYAQLESSMRSALVLFAYEAGREIHRQTHDEFMHYFYLSAYQRTIKAMGTFGYQASQGRRDFAAYLEPAQAMVEEIVKVYSL
ncbi:MAG TPA: phosphotransferase [Turneriella sp.]|nr:phosphotransferase [Turneriella sp.]